MNNKEIRTLTDKDLREKLANTQTEYQKMKMNHAISPLENPMRIKATRRDIARMKTELGQRNLQK